MPVIAKDQILRRCRFTPYRKGAGPTFTLLLWDTYQQEYGKSMLGYRLTMRQPATIDVQGNYGQGWETVCAEESWKEARAQVKTYRENERGPFRLKRVAGAVTVLFEGTDYGSSPCHAIDSDRAVSGIMGFLTCKPGDTDSEYFESYTPEQLAYCSEHAEYLSYEVSRRFGED